MRHNISAASEEAWAKNRTARAGAAGLVAVAEKDLAAVMSRMSAPSGPVISAYVPTPSLAGGGGAAAAARPTAPVEQLFPLERPTLPNQNEIFKAKVVLSTPPPFFSFPPLLSPRLPPQVKFDYQAQEPTELSLVFLLTADEVRRMCCLCACCL